MILEGDVMGKSNKIDRRNFLRKAAAAGLAPAFAKMTSTFASAETKVGTGQPNAPEKTQKPKPPQVPRRKLGKADTKVPSLCLGGNFSFVDKQIVLRNSVKWGVKYWDTATGYAGGNAELGMGKFLAGNPKLRKQLFIATKASGANTPADVEKRLQASLKRLNTGYIDLYYGVHGLSDPGQLTDQLRQWAQKAKKRKLIRFFGFTTHSNMAECLAAAAKLDWIDAIMTRYNFRHMDDAKMQAALHACHKAGIALIAMKVQAKGQKAKTEQCKELVEHFLQRGFTEGQVKLKVILEDKRFCSACIGMENVKVLNLNVAAVLDKTKLSQADIRVLKEYARATCSGYCAGCTNICNSALPDTPYVSDIMRYLMYYNSYGDKDRARELFAAIPTGVRSKLLRTDYTLAEAHCPQHIPIGSLVAEAASKLA